MCDYNIYENSEHEFLNLASEIFGCTYDDVLFLPAYRENIFHRDLLTSCIIFLSLARDNQLARKCLNIPSHHT